MGFCGTNLIMWNIPSFMPYVEKIPHNDVSPQNPIMELNNVMSPSLITMFYNSTLEGARSLLYMQRNSSFILAPRGVDISIYLYCNTRN